jgi:hypothetical protein
MLTVIFVKSTSLVADEAAYLSKTPQFAKLFAVMPVFEFEPLPTPHAGFCSVGRCLCYSRHYDTAIEGGIGAASI